MDVSDIIEHIRQGEVGVIPTDTLYGLVSSALIPEAVDRIYQLKKRDPAKPLIVLIADFEDIERFGVVLDEQLKEQLSAYWPGPYSIVLPTIDDTFGYLDRGTHTIAFRLPDNEELREFLRMTGPLVAPSANREGDPPAKSAVEAKSTFGDEAAFYIDGGERLGPASTILTLDEEGNVVVLREPR